MSIRGVTADAHIGLVLSVSAVVMMVLTLRQRQVRNSLCPVRRLKSALWVLQIV